MNTPRLTLLALAVVAASTSLSAQQPKDNFGDPLPEGAKARIGTTRMHKPTGGIEWGGAALTLDGKFLVSPVTGGAIEKIDVATGRSVGTIGEKVPERSGRDIITLSADGKRGMSLGHASATVWDAQTGRVLTRVAMPIDWTRPLATAVACLSADGTTFAFGDNPEESKKLTAVVWTVGEAKRKLTVEVAQDKTVAVSLSADGKLLATWGESRLNPPMVVPDMPIQFWDVTNGKKLGSATVKQAWVTGVVFTPDGKSAAVIDGKGAVGLLDPTTGRENKRLGVRAEMGSRVYFSPDGKTLAVAWSDGTLHLWDVGTDKLISTTKCPAKIGGSGMKDVVFLADGKAVTWGVEGSKAVVWEAPSGKLLSPTGGHTNAPGSLAFTPDGKELLSNGESWTEWTVQRWDATNGKPLGEVNFEIPKGINIPGYKGVRLFSGTKALASASGVQYVYDPRTGKRLLDPGRYGREKTLLYSSDGELILIPEDRGQDALRPWKVRVKELATDKQLCEIELPAGIMYADAVRTRDGSKLITTIYALKRDENRGDFVVTQWELATGKKVGEVIDSTGTSAVWLALAPGPTGKTAFMTESKNGLRVLDFTTGKSNYDINTGGLIPSAGPILSPDGKHFAVSLCDPDVTIRRLDAVRVYDADTGKALKTFRGHTGLISALAFSPDGKTLASGSHDTTVLLWDVSAVDQKPK